MTILQILYNNIQNDAIYKFGKILIGKDNSYLLEYAILKQTFYFILIFMIIRYIAYLFIYVSEKLKKKPVYINVFKKKVDIVRWIYNTCLIIIEFRLIALIQIMYF